MAETRWKIRIERSSELGMAIKAVDGGGHLTPFRATFTSDDESLELELVIDVIDGTPDCTSYRVTPLDGKGLLYRTTEISKGVKIRDAMALALTYAVIEDQGHGTYMDATSLDLIDSVRGTVKRRREPMTDDSLREFAARYRAEFVPGYAADFAESLGYSERQMYRRKKAAIDRCLLEEGK
jgi:hypothetical protein